MQSNPGQLLTFTPNPKLDTALQAGWETWQVTARAEGAERVATWLAHRLRNPALKTDLQETIETLLGADEPEERALALSEIAEIAETHDDLLADTLWEGVLAAGFESEDAESVFDATSHLAAIAEDHGESLAAAEYYIDFLNWRRQPDHASDPEAVESAFDDIIRLANLDGDRAAAALFEFRQAQFTRLVESDDDRATTGDWESDGTPYASWA
jgi:hypothetical protein